MESKTKHSTEKKSTKIETFVEIKEEFRMMQNYVQESLILKNMKLR